MILVALLMLAYLGWLVIVLCLLHGGRMKEDPKFEGDKIIYRS